MASEDEKNEAQSSRVSLEGDASGVKLTSLRGARVAGVSKQEAGTSEAAYVKRTASEILQEQISRATIAASKSDAAIDAIRRSSIGSVDSQGAISRFQSQLDALTKHNEQWRLINDTARISKTWRDLSSIHTLPAVREWDRIRSQIDDFNATQRRIVDQFQLKAARDFSAIELAQRKVLDRLRDFAGPHGLIAQTQSWDRIAERLRSIAVPVEGLASWTSFQETLRATNFVDRLSASALWSGANYRTVLGSVIAVDELVAAARESGGTDDLRGQSLPIDTFIDAGPFSEAEASGQGSDHAGAAFLATFFETASSYIQSARSHIQAVKIEAWIMMVLAAMAVYYAAQSATSEDIEKIGIELQTISRTLSEQLDELRRQTDHLSNLKKLHNRRTTPLKTEKSMRSSTLGFVPISEMVELLERDKKWVRVRYYDLASGETLEGWSRKKYFRAR